MLIRNMKTTDLKRVAFLESQLFTSAWSHQDLLYELNENQFSRYLVLELDDEIIGYIGIWLIYEQSQITTIGVDQAFQGQGYGKMLLEKAIDLAKQTGCEIMSLEVRVSNKKAIGLYEKMGFQKEAVRSDYYQDNHENAFLMVKRLEEKE